MKRWLLLTALLFGCATPQKRSESPAETQDASAANAEESAQPSPVGEFDVESIPVTFGADVELRGDLVRPLTSRSGPAAIIVHDWGVVGRDGIVSEVFGVRLGTEVPVYRSLAESLASRGVTVLLYDRRNCVRGTQPWCEYPPEYTEGARLPDTQLADLRTAIAWLGERERVDSVSLIGHGHGAEVAAIAASDAQIARLALLQPTMTPLDELARFQVDESIRQIDARVAQIGDTPEADLLKQQKQQLEAMVTAGDLLRLGADGQAQLDRLHDGYRKLWDDMPAELLVIEATVDPGEPATESKRRRDHFGDRVVRVPELSRTMVSVAEEDDAAGVSAEVVTRLSAFLAAAN